MSSSSLKRIINNFSIEDFKQFFRAKADKFKPSDSRISVEEFTNYFGEGKNLGTIQYDGESVLIAAFKSYSELSEKTSKKRQYDVAKKILKMEQNYDAGIFIFYDNKGNFRMSLVYEIPQGKKRNFSNFKRFTYFVEKGQPYYTFLKQIGEGDFSSLENIRNVFSVEPVTEQFYRELSDWYFWALKKVKFPEGAESQSGGRNVALIRLITRLMFVWYLKRRSLIPNELFDENKLKNILIDFDPLSKESNYYKAVLQNLFFATLSCKQDKRRFRVEQRGYNGYNSDFGNQYAYRYRNLFIIPKQDVINLFKEIPFLNGGLFENLDKGQNNIYIDGFTERSSKYQPMVPNFVFFSKEQTVDLSKDYGESKYRNEKVKGLLNIFKSYNFTIEESSPIDIEVALDPEMLGKVFENLLASYNPETATTARKATGSYYTPREIVAYMSEESLMEYFKAKISGIDENKLNQLFSYNNEENPFDLETTDELIENIHNLKVIDPAVGSGAFPMGILHKLVHVLHKLDPSNEKWKQKQLKAVQAIPDPEARQIAINAIEERFKENESDYGRKLYLIQNCLYGVDIQPIAIQICKLRFFISLLVDEKINKNGFNNCDIEPLPNLETNFACANTLIKLSKLPFKNEKIGKLLCLEKRLFDNRRKYFTAYAQKSKEEIKEEDKKLREQILKETANYLEDENNKLQKLKKEIQKIPVDLEEREIKDLFGTKRTIIVDVNEEKRTEIRKKINKLTEVIARGEKNFTNKFKKIASWKFCNSNSSAGWFDPEWMFGIKNGFDIVIANPPYGNLLKTSEKNIISTNYLYSTLSDISSPFVEKGVNLLKEGGVLIFIITFAITFNKKFSRTRELIWKSFERVFVYSFDRDRCKFFQNMSQSVSIMKCFNKNAGTREGIFTSRMFRETPDIYKIEVSNADKRLLPVGSLYEQPHRLPKIGEPINAEILDSLLIMSKDKKFENIITNQTNNVAEIWIRTSGNYWYNAFDRKPYESTKIKKIQIQAAYKDLSILLMNSSLFYFWFRVFGDGRDMNTDILRNFPIPHLNIVNQYGVLFKKMMEEFMKDLFFVFDNSHNRFQTSKIKDKIDLIDLVIGRLIYQLDWKHILAILNYDKEVRGGEKLDSQIKSFVDQILTITSKETYDPKANTEDNKKVKELEYQIDQLVYKLYGLTDEEIKIMEDKMK